MESIFEFLRDDNKFNQIYDDCVSFEKNILISSYSTSLAKARTIAESLLKKLVQTNKALKKKFSKTDENGRKYDWGMFRLIKGCYKEKLIDKNSREKYFTIKGYGDATVHGENYEKYDLDDCKKVHKLLFELSLDCFKRFHDDDLKFDYLNNLEYNYNLDNIEPLKFTAKQRSKFVDNLYENEINKDKFIRYLHLNRVYLDKSDFNRIISSKYKNYLRNEDDLNKFLDSNEYIKEEDLSEVLSFFEPSSKHTIYTTLKDINKNNLKNLCSYLDDFPENFTIEYISNCIDNSNELNKNKFNLIKDLAFNFLYDHLKVLTKELENESVIDEDEYGREIEKFKNYEIVKEDFGLKVKEVENSIFLDKDQKEAINYNGDKPLVINAGPGSGKTRVLIERVKFLVENGADPSSILVITFTNEATNELRNRLKFESGLNEYIVNQMHISTVHGFCRYLIANFNPIQYNYLERHGERSLFINKHKDYLGFKGYSKTYDSDVSIIIKSYDNFFNFGLKSEDYAENLKYLNYRKITPTYKEFVKDYQKKYGVFPSFDQLKNKNHINAHFHAKKIAIAKSYPKYLELLEEYRSCDDNTLLQKAYEILHFAEPPFKHILIDEFQDTNHHFRMIFDKLLEYSESFTIVGDSDQSIYGWRGALPSNFDDFTSEENRDDVKYVELHTNYRSTANIVDFNEEFIRDKRSTLKNLKAKKEYKAPVYFLNNSIGEEYENIASLIKSLYDDKKIKKYSDIAVLFRTNNEAMDFCLKLNEKGIPSYLKGNKDLLDQNEVKSLLILFWYLMEYDKTRFIYRSDKLLNLKGMASDFNDEFFNLSEDTKEVLKSIQSKFEEDIVKSSKEYDKRCLNYKDVYKKENDFIERVLSHVDSRDLAELNETGLKNLGIYDENDINFFLSLKDIKSRMYGNNSDKPTTLNIFNELIHINNFIDRIAIQTSPESNKIEKNLGLISRIIKDYEKIMGKSNYYGLFDYLNSVLESYSSYVDESETFDNEVHIMTVHKSKGLEYPIVIIASLNDGSFPSEYKSGKWDADIKYLEYKPNNISDEKKQHNLEERRMIYVAASRAKEILILSSNNDQPKVFSDLKNSSNINTKTLTRNYFNIIPKIESSNSSSSNIYLPELSFEKILNDYIFCPYKYYLSNEPKFAAEVSDDAHLEMVLHSLLNSIHSNDDLKDEDIKLNVDTMLKYHDLSRFENDKKIIANVTNYWNDYGKDYNVFKKNYVVSKHLSECDLSGTIDLIVEEDTGYSIVQFIGSDNRILDMSHYELFLHFYSSALKEDVLFKDKKLNYIVLHSLETNSIKTFKINEDYEKYCVKKLDLISAEILNKKFIKKDNCENCEYNLFCNK